MLRIRFHGRGGQGLKTACRIVGTAACGEGRDAQDSPVYGAGGRRWWLAPGSPQRPSGVALAAAGGEAMPPRLLYTDREAAQLAAFLERASKGEAACELS